MQVKRAWKQVDGVLLLDKPIGLTSNDALQKVRRLFSAAKGGHTGTLDPLATGLMILLIGKATSRAADFSGLDKEYRGSMRLGLTTDSWDMDGRILAEAEVPELTERRLRDVFLSLSGERDVLPPSFSALKQNGVRAYDRARRGEHVTLEKRPMRIDAFDLEAFETPEVYFRLSCSKGTYVRSLCQETGQSLGCGAALSSLVRTRIGSHRLSEALDWDRLKRLSPAQIEVLLRAAE